MTRQPRLLYVVSEDWYFLSHRLPMARAAQDMGFEVHVATRVDRGAGDIRRHGFVLHPIPYARGARSLLAHLKTILALRRVHAAIRPDLVHHVALLPTMIGLLAMLGRPTASVNALTGLGYLFISRAPTARAARRVFELFFRFFINRPRTVALVQNPDDAAALAAMGIRDAHIVLIPGSGIDTTHFQPLPEPDGPITLGFVGRLLEDKGIRTLLAAHRMLRDKGLDIRLLIAGTPDPANPTSLPLSEAQSWDEAAGIVWLGHVENVTRVWARAHIAVLPSRREGLPKSLLEAAACSRPMVATDVPGCREVAIAGETGELVPADDATALAGAIETLYADPQKRRQYGEAARALTESRFSTRQIERQIAGLYDSLCNRQPTARQP
jgi:glycosyltransferase involved in cell wall biosynthesis